MYLLPKDLNSALNDIEHAVKSSLKDNKLRYTIELKFDGLRLNNIEVKHSLVLTLIFNWLLFFKIFVNYNLLGEYLDNFLVLKKILKIISTYWMNLNL